MIVKRCTSSQVEMDWIRSESKKGYYELGFLPWPAIERYAAWGDLYLLTDGEELFSFVIIRSAKGRLRIFQMWTREDVRRHQFARELFVTAIVMAKKNSEQLCSLWCRENLEANIFWRSLGFEAVALREGGVIRKIMQVGYERRLDQSQKLFSGSSAAQLERSQLRIETASPLRGRRITRNSGPRPADAS
jgi:hypothetical protein